MKYDKKAFFVENGDPTVTGFTIIELGDGEYRIAEKWERNDGPRWTTYWIDSDQLESREERGVCKKRGMVSDEQFEAICHKTDERALA